MQCPIPLKKNKPISLRMDQELTDYLAFRRKQIADHFGISCDNSKAIRMILRKEMEADVAYRSHLARKGATK